MTELPMTELPMTELPMTELPMIELPVIDIARLDGTGRSAVVAALGAACRGPGFFYVTGHGVPDAVRQDVFAAAHGFFGQTLDAKLRQSIALSPHNRGYVALGAERLDSAAPADRKEAFNIGLDYAADHPDVLAGKPFRGVNLWPDLPGFRAALLAYFDACWALGRTLHRALALDLGLDAAFFEDKLDAPLATLRLLRYPAPGEPADSPADAPGAGAHTDYGNITILATDGVAGLQVRRRDGGWIDAPHVPGAFVCNIGDCLMRWTNDIYVSTPHRVLRPVAERYAVAFFLDPNPDAVVATPPALLAPGAQAKYPPVTGAAYLRGRLEATYPHLNG